MPFKVRCRFKGFVGDPDSYPCHFDYKIGDYFTYDGEKFEGRICNGLLKNMSLEIWNTFFYGNNEDDRMLYLYSGFSARDEKMKEYDGIGYRPLRSAPKGASYDYILNTQARIPKRLVKRIRGFVCDDTKTGAYFACEPVDLAKGGDLLPYYKRQMSILEKVKEEPGMTVAEILMKYTKWEKENIYPRLRKINVSLMLDELATVNYIELRRGRAYPKD